MITNKSTSLCKCKKCGATCEVGMPLVLPMIPPKHVHEYTCKECGYFGRVEDKDITWTIK